MRIMILMRWINKLILLPFTIFIKLRSDRVTRP